MADAERILFLTISDDVGSDRIVRELGRQGAACAVLGPPGCFASLSRFVAARFALPTSLGAWAATLSVRARLMQAAREWQTDRVVPLDELSALLLRTIATETCTAPDIRAVLVRSLGRPQGYAASCHRVPLMRVAEQAGVPIPGFCEVAQIGSLGEDPFPLVVKRDHSSGSGGVAIVETPAALRSALQRARLKRRAKRLLARTAGFDHGEAPILVQRHVAGPLAMRTVVALDGVVIDGVDLMAAQSHPLKRASTVLEPIDCPGMADSARRLVAALGCSGFVSFDFIIDRDGRPMLIEMNPRPVGSMHLGRLFGHDLGRAFLEGKPVPSDGKAHPRAVALFPKELERDPTGAIIDGRSEVHHDVAYDDPDVLAAYLAHLVREHPAEAASLQARFAVPGPAAQNAGISAFSRLSRLPS